MMKYLFFLFISLSLFAKNIYFQGGKMSLQELALTVSLETNKEILLSQNLNDKIVYLRVGKVISTQKLFSYFKSLINANGLSLQNKNGYYIVSPISDLMLFRYRFKYQNASNFEPFIKPYKTNCSLGHKLVVCRLIPKEYFNLKKIVNSFDVPLPKDPFKNKTLEISLKIFESNYNDLYNLQNSLSLGVDSKPLKIDSTLSKGLSSVINLFLGGSSVLNTLKLGFVFDYLKQHNISTVTTQPTILVTNNHTSSITTGGTQRVVSSTSKNKDLSAETTNYKEFVTGLQLSIKAHIIKNNLYLLDIKFNNEDVIGGTSELPITSKQAYSTSITLSSDKSFVLGGVVYNKISKQNNSVPFISNIPILGIPFKNVSNVKEKKVLTIVISVKGLK